MRPLKPIDLAAWIESHRPLLRPPVGNKLVYEDTEFIIMVVGGPNERKDFHVDPGEEFFHQIEGTMVLQTIQDGQRVEVPIRAGEMLLLPPGVPHSPRRDAGSVGLVLERRRRAGELDALQWYCEACDTLLYQEQFALQNIETQLPPVMARFFGSLSLRTCRHCHAIMQPPGTPGPTAGATHGAQ